MNLFPEFMEDSIKKQFNSILEYTQGYSVNTDELFKQWEKNKSHLIDLLGDRLIHNYGLVNFHLSEQEKTCLIRQLIDLAKLKLKDEKKIAEFEEFIYNNKDSFFDNVVRSIKPNYNPDLKVGMKIVKAFKFFIDNKKDLDCLQKIAALYIQKNKIAGELCISVHPLDYLTLSLNTYNWTTCCALDKEYRAGCLSYMGDETTCVCYLKGEEELIYPKLPLGISWNSKKWRMLVHINPNWSICFLGRQYPYALSGIEETVRKSLLSNLWEPFRDNYINKIDDEGILLDDKYCILASTDKKYELAKLSNVVQNANCDPLHFNDLLYSSTYTEPKYSSNPLTLHSKKPELIIGSDIKCVHCGQYHIDSNSSSMLCKHCKKEI